MARRWIAPRWRVVVLAVVGTGAIAVTASVADVMARGATRPAYVAIGVLATIAINRIYVVVARRGGVLAGIDVAEIPIVALALALPPGEALLTFFVGSVIVEALMDRAVVKKLFNVGARATAAGVLVVTAEVMAPYVAQPSAARYVAVGIGAVAYTAVNALWLAAVVSAVERTSFRSVLADGLLVRTGTAFASIMIGMTAGRLETHAPIALLGLAAPLVLLTATVHALRHAQLERDRLQSMLDATSRIQSVDDPDAQEAALVEAARELLLWKDVEVRGLPPQDDEIGSRLYVREGVERWLVSRPRVDSDPWSREDATVIETLTSAASAALERAHLQQEMGRLALIDPLTGLANRRHMDDALAALMRPDNARPFALLVIDVDDFKNVNDEHGHEAGDGVLRCVADRLRNCVRTGDIVARLGGDEFVVVLPAVTSRSVLRAIVDTVHARVSQPIDLDGELIDLAVSVGFALSPAEGTSVVALMRAADQRMYREKSAHHTCNRPQHGDVGAGAGADVISIV